jgi:hypothetical protein
MKSPLILIATVAGLLSAQEPAPAPPPSTAPTDASASAPAPAPEAAAEDDSPVKVPPLDHFQRLWSDSLFTTRALPMAEIASGPSFADSYTLCGTLEENGKLTALLLDKATSSVITALIGEDNAEGFRISKIEPGAIPDQTRIQLQKGNQVGWVSFADAGAGGDNSAAAQAGMTGGILATQPQQPGMMPGMPMNPKMAPQQMHMQQQQPPPIIPMPGDPSAQMRMGMPQAEPSIPNEPPLPPP